MLKIVVAMIIGAGLGAAFTHGVMTRVNDAAVDVGSAVISAPAEARSMNVQSPAFLAAEFVPSASAPTAGMRANPATVAPTREALVVGGIDRIAGAVGPTSQEPVTAVTDAASFEEAFSWVLAGSDGDTATLAALRSIPERWLSESPGEVIAALDRIGSPVMRQEYLAALSRAAVLGQPELLPEIVSHLRAMSEKGSVINGVMQGLQTSDDPAALLDIAGSLPGMLGNVVERMVYSQIAARDPLEALARVAALPPGETRQMMTMQSIMQLASRDPNGALAWLGANQGNVDPNLYANVATALSRQDPQLAAQYVPSVPESARGPWIAAVARSMATTDVEGALSWLGAYRNTGYYSDAVAGIAQQLAGFNPARAAQLLGEINLASPQGQAAVSGVAMMWAGADSDAATSWARSLPRGDTRDRALVALAPRLGEQMLDDSMLDLFSNPQIRDSAAGSAIAGVAQGDPQRAQELIDAHISSPATAQRISSMVASGGAVQHISMITMPAAGASVAPSGVFMYSDVGGGAVPALGISGGLTNFILQAPEQE